eukprot:362298-Chlamydomonas_euryale.AAC.8
MERDWEGGGSGDREDWLQTGVPGMASRCRQEGVYALVTSRSGQFRPPPVAFVGRTCDRTRVGGELPEAGDRPRAARGNAHRFADGDADVVAREVARRLAGASNCTNFNSALRARRTRFPNPAPTPFVRVGGMVYD